MDDHDVGVVQGRHTASASRRKPGREEVYVVNYLTDADEIMAASVDAEGDDLIFGEPHVLFKAPILGWNDLYDVTRDGQRFLILTGEQYRPTTATILLNWFEKPANE